MRLFGAWAALNEKIQGAFGDTPLTAFDGVLERLEGDPVYSALDQRLVVPLLFGFLAAARTGLDLGELSALVERHYPWKPPDTELVSPHQSQASRREQASDAVNLCLRQMRPFLARRGGRIDLLYESLRLAAARRYYQEPTAQRPMNRPAVEWHRRLAEWFQAAALGDGEATDTEPLFDVAIHYDATPDLLSDRWRQRWFRRMKTPHQRCLIPCLR